LNLRFLGNAASEGWLDFGERHSIARCGADAPHSLDHELWLVDVMRAGA
jgi:hypothetical protein